MLKSRSIQAAFFCFQLFNPGLDPISTLNFNGFIKYL